MEKKFSLHKLWFFYNDDWIGENGIAQSIGTFSTLEAAETEKKRLDRQSLKKMESHDLIRDLTGFFDTRFKEVEDKLVAYAKTQGWDDLLKQQPYGNNPDKFYYEMAYPTLASDEQLDAILEITGASFHKILAYKDVKEHVYVKLNYEFWGKKVFDKLKADGILDSRSPHINGDSHKGFYLINIPPKGRKSAKFSSEEAAIDIAIKVFLESVTAFPDNQYLGKTYVEDWSEDHIMLMVFLQNCTTIQLHGTEITPANSKAIAAKLKKLKSAFEATEGIKHFDVQFGDVASTKREEVLGLIELLKVKPFTLYNMISEIDGQAITDYAADSSTL